MNIDKKKYDFKNKAFIFLILTFISSFNALKITAQSGRIYDDLLVLLVNEEYKDCFNKSVKYTLKDKTKKIPFPTYLLLNLPLK